jgi:hypothetical protein
MGGTVTSTDGRVSVAVPAGAVSSDLRITIAKLADDASEHVAKGSTYEFGPSGTQFAQPVELRLAYDTTGLGVGADRSALRVARRQANGEWTMLDGAVIDSTNRTVRGLTSSFSTYGVYVDPCAPRYFPAPQGTAIPQAGVIESADCRDNGIRADAWRQYGASAWGGWGEYEITSSIPHRAIVGSGARTVNSTRDWTSAIGTNQIVEQTLPNGGSTLVRVAGVAPMALIAGLDSTVRGGYTVRYQPMTSREVTSGNGCSRGVFVEVGTSVVGDLTANGDCAITIQFSPFPEVNGKVAYADYFWVKARPTKVRLVASPQDTDSTKYRVALTTYRNGQVVAVSAKTGQNAYELDMTGSGGTGYYLVEVSNGVLSNGVWQNGSTSYSFSVQCVNCAPPGALRGSPPR